VDHLLIYKGGAKHVIASEIQDLGPKIIVGKPRENDDSWRAERPPSVPDQRSPTAIRKIALTDHNWNRGAFHPRQRLPNVGDATAG
jgi:hypothetical protein